jgi:DUF4097 and DUF4098 domain-containing protein YvlB
LRLIKRKHDYFFQEEIMNLLSRKIRIGAVIFAGIFLLMTGFSSADIEDTISKSFSVSPGGKLTVDADLGSIEIKTTRSSSVEVEIQRKVKTSNKKDAERILSEYKIDFDQQGNDVFITADYKKTGLRSLWDKVRKKLRVKYYISVPSVYNVQLRTSGGSIYVDNLEGRAECRTSGGSLTFEDIKGPVKGKTSGGSIKLGEVQGDVDVDTSGGSIKISRVSGTVKAHTSGGGISVEEVMGTVNATTSGGSVKAYISRQPAADCRLTTSGGSVTAYLADDIAVDVNARTSGGRVHTDFPVKIQGKISGRSLKAKINGGGPELYLKSSGGSIYIKKK